MGPADKYIVYTRYSKKLAEIEEIINQTDIPVRQVMIESRLVLADEKFGKSLGARFGVQSATTPGDNVLNVGGTLSANGDAGNGQAGSTTGLNSNLPITATGAGSLAFSLFRLPAGLLLNLELTALETDNRGKIVSSPRVTTADQQTAKLHKVLKFLINKPLVVERQACHLKKLN